MTTPPNPGQPYPQHSPGYPAAPPPPSAPAGPALVPPTELKIAFWAFLLSGVLAVVSSVLLFGDKQQIVDTLRNRPTGVTFDDSQLDSLANTGIVTAIVIAVIVAFLYALFAFKLKAGRNWARIVLTIIAVLALLSLVARQSTTTPVGYVGAVLAIVAAVLSYLPKSSAYIAAAKQRNH